MRRIGVVSGGEQGFTLLEVMIAILILGIGLLGFALLQTKSVSFVRSANQRTQAINLASDMLDQMRSNRLLAAQYAGATFTGGTPSGQACVRSGTDIAANIARWQCEVRNTLGDECSATVTFNNGLAGVELLWDDQSWEQVRTRKDGDYRTGRVRLETRL